MGHIAAENFSRWKFLTLLQYSSVILASVCLQKMKKRLRFAIVTDRMPTSIYTRTAAKAPDLSLEPFTKEKACCSVAVRKATPSNSLSKSMVRHHNRQTSSNISIWLIFDAWISVAFHGSGAYRGCRIPKHVAAWYRLAVSSYQSGLNSDQVHATNPDGY